MIDFGHGQESLLTVLKGPYVVLRIEPGFVMCKLGTLTSKSDVIECSSNFVFAYSFDTKLSLSHPPTDFQVPKLGVFEEN